MLKVKFLPYLALLIPLHIQALPQYPSKNIPLAYTETYEQGTFAHTKRYITSDMLQCTQQYFPKRVFKDFAYLQLPLHFAKSKQTDKGAVLANFETFNFENQEALSNWLSAPVEYAHSGAVDKEKMTSFYAHYSANHLVGRSDQESLDHCYINVFTDFNRVEISQVQVPVSPVPEMPQSTLLIVGLGFMVFAQRHKLFV